MILVDTSAWIEFLRGTDSPVCNLVDEMISEEILICDIVRMEVLAGARDESHLANLRRLLARAGNIPTIATDYDDAAPLYRQCRRRGETVRKIVDCLIAATAIREGVPVLHNDTDFETLARCTDLLVYGN